MKNRNRIKYKNIIIVMSVFVFVCMTAAVYFVYEYLNQPKLDNTEIILYTGYCKTLDLKGKSEAIEWYSKDEEIAMVDGGKVSGIAPGTTDICVKTEKKTLFCRVEVRESKSPRYFNKVAEEKEWVLGQQLDNGAFALRRTEDGEVIVNPYFSSQVAMLLLECDLRQEEIECVKKYMDWHFKHLNLTEDYNGLAGTIYDYKAVVKNGIVTKESTENTYDSADSYAAVFLSVLWNYYDKTGDEKYIAEHFEEIEMVTDVLLESINKGYSLARPDYPVKYLMDNSETYYGLICAEKIYKNIFEENNKSEKAEKIRANYQYMKENFDSIWWNEEYYYPALNVENKRGLSKFSWQVFYSDSVSQLSPVIFGLCSEEKSQFLYKRFCEEWQWQNMDYIETESDFYWGEIMYAAAVMKDEERAAAYMEKYCALTKDRKYPLIANDSAWVMAANNIFYQYYKEIELAHADS